MVRELSFRSLRCSDQCKLGLVVFLGIPAVLAATMIARRMYRTVAAVRVRIAKIKSGARDPSD